jgi:hypothetical protein
VAEHPGAHSWNAGNRLQEDEADHPLAFIHDIWFVRIMSIARGYVHAFSKQSAKAKCHPVRPSLAFSMSNPNCIHVLFAVDGMVPCWRGDLDRGGIFGRWEVFETSGRGGGEVSS